jgi:tetratricopeptide (TPR) repeat protein
VRVGHRASACGWLLVCAACAGATPTPGPAEVPEPADWAAVAPAARAPLQAAAAECRAHPSEAAAFEHLGRLYHGTEQPKLAARCYRQAIALGSADPHTRYFLALIDLENGRSDAALDELRWAIEREPGYAPLQFNLGRALLDVGQIAPAIAALERASELDPRQAGYAATLGRALRQAGRLEPAVAALRRALELDPGEPDAHQLLGLTLKALGRDAEAAGHLAQPARGTSRLVADPWLLEVQKTAVSPEVLIDRAEAHLARGRIDAAIELLTQVTAAHPEHGAAARALGRALLAAGRRDEALRAMTRATTIDPRDAEAHAVLAMIAFERGRTADAEREADLALGLVPAHPLGSIVKAGLTLEAGRAEQALALITPVVGRNDSLAAAHVVRADALARLGRYAEAVPEYRRAIELEPRSDYPQRRLEEASRALGRPVDR